MNHFVPGNNGADPEALNKAGLHLKRLSRRWRKDILWIFSFRFAQFLANVILIVLTAQLLAELVIHHKNTGFAKQFTSIGLTMLLKSGLTYLLDRKVSSFSAVITLNVRNTLFRELENQLYSPSFEPTTGTLSLSFSEKTEALVPYFTRYLPQVLLSVTAPLVLITYLFTLNWVCGAIMLLTLPLIPIYMILTGKGTAEAAREQWHALSRMGGYFYDRLKGVTTLFVYGQLSAEVENVEKASVAYGDSAFKVLRMAFLSSAVLEFFSTIIIAGIAIYTGLSLINYIHWGAAGNFTLAESLVILMLVPDFLSALKTLGTFYHDRSMALGAIIHFQEEGFFNLLNDYSDLPFEKAKVPFYSEASELPAVISIDNLGFWYPGMPLLFRGLTLHVPPKEKLIIKGPNGSGKSTLFSLLLGFLSPVYGKILLDGQQTEHMNQQLLSGRISWTGQHPKIFKGTLRSNLLMGNPLNDAAILALVEDYFDSEIFFLPFPEGLDTRIADDGRSVSGGERQKIALLRTVIKHAGVILLDEPFANLDQAATDRFMEALNRNMQNKTIILILHEETTQYKGYKTVNINENLEVYNHVL